MVEKEKDSERKRGCKLSKVIACTAVLFVAIAIAFASLAVAVAPVIAQEEEVTVKVNAPEYVEEKATFDVTIDVDSVINFNAGEFDLYFDRSVVKVSGVEDGSIDGETIPVDMWKFMERDTIRVFLDVPGITGVNGSGYLAKINFKVKGDEGDECVLDIDNGMLGNTSAEEIPAEWVDARITVGGGKDDKDERELPDITAWEPTEEVVSSAEGESVTFEIAVEDQKVDISWQIDGTEVKTEEGVTEAEFTKSADAGTWNVSAIATSTKTELSSMHTWIWSVTPTSTSTEAPEETPAPTPTPTLAPGETPSTTPTLAPGETPLQEVTPGIKPTPKPTTPPTTEENATPTPKPAIPGFEAVFAIVGLVAIAYILLRKR